MLSASLAYMLLELLRCYFRWLLFSLFSCRHALRWCCHYAFTMLSAALSAPMLMPLHIDVTLLYASAPWLWYWYAALLMLRRYVMLLSMLLFRHFHGFSHHYAGLSLTCRLRLHYATYVDYAAIISLMLRLCRHAAAAYAFHLFADIAAFSISSLDAILLMLLIFLHCRHADYYYYIIASSRLLAAMPLSYASRHYERHHYAPRHASLRCHFRLRCYHFINSWFLTPLRWYIKRMPYADDAAIFATMPIFSSSSFAFATSLLMPHCLSADY